MKHGFKMIHKVEQNMQARRASFTLLELGETLIEDEDLDEERFWLAVQRRVDEKTGRPELTAKYKRPWPKPWRPSDDAAFPFGTHKDERMDEVPDDYYNWLANQPWIDEWPAILAYIQHYDLD